MAENIFYTLILIMNCFISAFSQVLLKKASLRDYKSFIRQYFNLYVLFGYGLFFLVLFVNVILLRKLPLTVVSPVGESLSIVLSFLSGWFIFKEKLSTRKVIGAVVILFGMCVILL